MEKATTLSGLPHLCDAEHCTYCQACGSACAHGAIRFEADACGFAHPWVDAELCVGCGLCEQVCPVIHPLAAGREPRVLALYSKDDATVRSSSSGGVFGELAAHVLDGGGCVFGAVARDGRIYHTRADCPEEVEPMKGSKYVQSDVGDCYRQARRELARGRQVLFTGTPCQVAAARPVVLIGYSGGALASGLIIQKYPQINVAKWITIAGVLNHADWTEYFGDSPLKSSINMNTLPRIQQTHYVAENDQTVPNSLSFKWTGGANTVVVPGATHDDFGQWQPEI